MAAFVSKKYSWGSYGYSVNPEVVGKTIERIEEEKGSVDAGSFLDASRPISSSTHSLFEWDDSIAAEKYRLQQSGQIISSLRIEVIPVTEEEHNLNLEIVNDIPHKEKLQKGTLQPAFVNVKKKVVGEAGKYVNLETAMSDVDTRKIILENAFKELRTFMEKYKRYSELSKVFAAIEELETEIGA